MSERAFEAQVADRLPGVHPEAVAFIKSRLLYVEDQSANDALMSLVALSNDDKHKTLTVIASTVFDVRSQVDVSDCQVVSTHQPRVAPLATAGAVIGHLECRMIGPNPRVRMSVLPQFHIALEDGRGFGDVLAGIEREVETIVNAAEIAAALTV
jgi:hypothetical protein